MKYAPSLATLVATLAFMLMTRTVSGDQHFRQEYTTAYGHGLGFTGFEFSNTSYDLSPPDVITATVTLPGDIPVPVPPVADLSVSIAPTHVSLSLSPSYGSWDGDIYGGGGYHILGEWWGDFTGSKGGGVDGELSVSGYVAPGDQVEIALAVQFVGNASGLAEGVVTAFSFPAYLNEVAMIDEPGPFSYTLPYDGSFLCILAEGYTGGYDITYSTFVSATILRLQPDPGDPFLATDLEPAASWVDIQSTFTLVVPEPSTAVLALVACALTILVPFRRIVAAGTS